MEDIHLDWVVAGVPRNLPQEAIGLPLQQSHIKGKKQQYSAVLCVRRGTQDATAADGAR